MIIIRRIPYDSYLPELFLRDPPFLYFYFGISRATCDFSQLEILYSSIGELNEVNKAIVLFYLDGNSYEEIAEITGIFKTNVGIRMSRIGEEYPDGEDM